MELDLDSFLQSQTTDDEDDGDSTALHRTVDDILNDSDSSSSTSSFSSSSYPSKLPFRPVFSVKSTKPSSPPPQAQIQDESTGNTSEVSLQLPAIDTVEETLESAEQDEPSNPKFSEQSKLGFNRRRVITTAPGSFTLGRNVSSLPPLFGGIRPNPKPGAALAAAAAASHLIPTPHAAAIRFRRANGALQKANSSASVGGDSESVLEEDVRLDGVSNDDLGEPGNSGYNLHSAGSEIAQLDSNLDREDKDDVGNGEKSDSSNVESTGEVHFHDEISNRDQIHEIAGKTDEFDSIEDVKNNVESFQKDEIQLYPEEDSVVAVEQQIPFTDEDPGEIISPVDKIEEGDQVESGQHHFDDNSVIDSTEYVEDRLVHLETKRSGKRVGKKSYSLMKPLELAEELEKKHASSGLHWEEGAAAQPMRLEGIRRGPPAVGYLHIDPDNAISRVIMSQGLGRDHGSIQVLAVHMNYVAVGMSKGLVIVVHSKYSAHSADNVDAKVLMLGSQSEKSHSPVTSMCFNQQGDLLLVGYGNGHVTVWDVQKSTAVKIITGEHTAPVVHTLFLAQDSQVTRQFKAVTGDSKGLVLLHAFSVVPLLNRFSIKTQCLLDGQRTGTVLSASPLLIDDPHYGGLASVQGSSTAPGGLGSMMGGVVGGEAGWKLFSDGSSIIEEGVVIFVTYQTALVVRLSPTLEVYAQLSKPDGVREGSMPYAAWKCAANFRGSSTDASDKASLLALAWDRKVQVAKLVKSDLKVYREWDLDSAAVGVAWLDDQMMVVLTLKGHLCLFSKEGAELHRTGFVVDGSAGDDTISYHTHFTNVFGNPEKAYHNSIAVRGATIYIISPTRLVASRLLPWKERIQVLQRAGDWMGALVMAMRLYDGQAHGVIDLPRTADAIRDAIMPFLVELLLAYVDEVFSYISVAFCNQIGKQGVNESKIINSSMHSEIEEQFARVGGVALEFCVHINRIDVLFDNIFSKFVAVQHGGTFLELLEPYILKDMLGCLPPEIMQALVEHYSGKGWLQRVEQCVLHMDISSLDFNQVVRLCREHGLYGALIYLFNRGLDDFTAPLEELLVVAQNSQRDIALAIGYRMLVYLKYCFLGLAFPPGHGTLPPSRVPLLRTELLQFLLGNSSSLNSQTSKFSFSRGGCPNLCYLLWLDTEATLEVLRCAFVEEESIKPESLIDASVEYSRLQNAELQSSMAQNTVDTLIGILEMEISGATDTGSLELWPSKKELGLMFEFIAGFVACQSVTVPKSILNRILEYLIADSGPSPWVPGLENGSSYRTDRREKQVLALLKVVPETDWDLSYVLKLCKEAQFYQVCSLIHMKEGQYLAALDSYMKDKDEPIHAFAFINKMLLELKDDESSAFRLAVISRIPELVNLSREGAFFLVIDHFSRETEKILSELRSHPESLFLYLKTTIDVHLSGTPNFSVLEKGDVSEDFPCGRKMKDQSKECEAYLERISNFPKLLRHNSVHVTDDMAELYLELLCQYEPKSVLKFLETFENYRLEHCLRLCQEYGVTDAAAFLLERVGDVGSALSLTVSEIHEKLRMIDIAMVSEISSTEMDQLSSFLRMKEVTAVHDLLHASIALCQRNTRRLDLEESATLWFKLLDSFCEGLRDLYNDRNISKGRNHADRSAKWRISRFDKGFHIFRRVLSQFIGEIVEGMVGFVSLPTIMAKLLSDNGSQEFGDYKLTILGLLGTYGYERRILDKAKTLIENDTFYTMNLLKKGASHAYAPLNLICCICNCPLTKDSSTSSIRLFNCGHATHSHCGFQENESSSSGCPVCMPKNSRSKSKSVLKENGLVKNCPSKTQGVINADSDLIEKPYGLQQISRFEFLNNLEKGQRSLQIDTLPPLKLAPPAIYYDKVKKNSDVLFKGESSSSPVKNEKASKNRRSLGALKSKGSTFQFPLKSNIFGNEKKKRR